MSILKVYLAPQVNKYLVFDVCLQTTSVVHQPGKDILSCNCKFALKHNHIPNFRDQHTEAVSEALEQKLPLTREPVILKEPMMATLKYTAFCGEKYLGLVENKEAADILTDAWFAETRQDSQKLLKAEVKVKNKK